MSTITFFLGNVGAASAPQNIMLLNKSFHELGLSILKIRVKCALHQFVLPNHLQKFLRILAEERSVIAGSVAMSVVAPEIFVIQVG